jgi:hypothetical protein
MKKCIVLFFTLVFASVSLKSQIYKSLSEIAFNDFKKISENLEKLNKPSRQAIVTKISELSAQIKKDPSILNDEKQLTEFFTLAGYSNYGAFKSSMEERALAIQNTLDLAQ